MNGKIAIVGYSVRLPGGDDVTELDRFLLSGGSAIRTHRRDELLEQGIEACEIDDPNYVPCSATTGWTVETAEHLGMLSSRERRVTDPQQLLFFDCCVAALEHAGIPPEAVAGRDVACVGGIGMGLYAGNELSSFFTRHLQGDRRLMDEAVPPEILVGNASDHTVGRVSYRLGLSGPSVNVQTACSTALASIEYACTLLKAGRVDLAVAGAASLYFPMKRGFRYERGGILSPDGVCRAFDSKAMGTVGGSGGGVFALKRLDDAIRDGDAIHGVIEGIFQGSDGGSRASYAAPAYDGQMRVIRGALRDAGLDPSSIAYVEGHGTGTPVGDLVELSALNEVFGDRDRPLPVGAVKPTLGHLDAAAAVASLANVLLGLRRGSMPGTVNFVQTDPSLADGIARPSATPVALCPAAGDGTVRVGISSFGASGTSVHAIVSDYAITERAEAERPDLSTAITVHRRGDTVGADVAEPASRPGLADEDAIRTEVLELIADRASTEGLHIDDIRAMGTVDLGLDSMDLLAVAKVIQSRWGVEFDVIEMLLFTSVDEMIDAIVSGVAGSGES